MRLAILTSHPVQYYAPLFRELAKRIDLHVFFAHKATAQQQGQAGFGTAFEWDVDLLGGYPNSFLANVAADPHPSRFSGCDTPEIGDRLREGGFTALLSLGWHLKSLLQGMWAAKRQGLPVVVRGDSQLGLTPSRARRAVKRIVYPPLLRMIDAVACVGTRNREYFRHYGYPGHRLFFSPHAIDTEWFGSRATAAARAAMRGEMGIASHEYVVLFAGKLVEFKRPLDSVEAVAILRSQGGVDAKLMIAGSGPLQEKVEQSAAERSVPLALAGFLNQTKMPSAYAAADALMLPSTGRETWGLVCNEALACGTPIVVSDAAGCAPDLCTDNAVGQAYACGRPDLAAAALCRLHEAPPPHEAIAALSERFSLARAADGIIAAVNAAGGR